MAWRRASTTKSPQVRGAGPVHESRDFLEGRGVRRSSDACKKAKPHTPSYHTHVTARDHISGYFSTMDNFLAID